MLASASSAAQTKANARCETVQFRLTREDAPESVRRYVQVGSHDSYALNDTVVADARSIANVEVMPSYGVDSLRDVIIVLNSSGAADLHRLAAAHIDQHFAVLLDDELIFVAVIAGPTGEQVPIQLGVTAARANAVRAAVNRARTSRCPSR
jgi:preprotein translocase subunit SecD